MYSSYSSFPVGNTLLPHPPHDAQSVPASAVARQSSLPFCATRFLQLVHELRLKNASTRNAPGARMKIVLVHIRLFLLLHLQVEESGTPKIAPAPRNSRTIPMQVRPTCKSKSHTNTVKDRRTVPDSWMHNSLHVQG